MNGDFFSSLVFATVAHSALSAWQYVHCPRLHTRGGGALSHELCEQTRSTSLVVNPARMRIRTAALF